MKCPTNRHIDHRQQKKERKRVVSSAEFKPVEPLLRVVIGPRKECNLSWTFQWHVAAATCPTGMRGQRAPEWSVSSIAYFWLARLFCFLSTVLACGDRIRPMFRLLVIFICGCVEPVRPFASSHLYFAFSNSFIPVDLTAALICQTYNLHYCTLHVLFSRYCELCNEIG